MTDAELPLTHVHLAPQTRTDGPDPAVFVLHGRGANEEDLLPLARRLPDAYHVVSLRAPDRLQGGYTWYELDLSAGGLHQSQPHPEEFRRSLDLVSEAIDAAVEAYDLDASRLGLLGFSQGAITGLSLLLENPDRFAWVVALHGYLASSHADLDPAGIDEKPVFVGAGTADQIIPVRRAEAAAERLRGIGADVTFNSYDAPHGVGPDELADLVAFVEDQTEGTE
ncbi:alpha/beta hydrolase [Haloferacaceae archaeon DSL9]